MGSLVAELAEKLSSATNNFDIDEGTMYVNTSADTVGIGTTNPASKLDVQGTMQVGVNDTGHDVKFFGATAGAYLEWDESADELEIRGGVATPGKLLLSTAETTVVDGNKLGQIDFQAPVDSAGTDAILVGASIYAEADATFSASVNATELVFATGASEAAAEKMRITSDGKVGIGTTAPVTTWAAGVSALALKGASGDNYSVLELYNHGTDANNDYLGIIDFGEGSNQNASIRAQRESATNDAFLTLWTNNQGSITEKMRISASGLVGIGTTAPSSALHISGGDVAGSGTSNAQLHIRDTAAFSAAQNAGIAFEAEWQNGSFTQIAAINASRDSTSTGQYGGHLKFNIRTHGANVSEAMRILSDGKVGIGTTAPGALLHVIGNNDSTSDATAGRVIVIGNSDTTNDNYSSLLFRDGGGQDVALVGAKNTNQSTNQGDLVFWTRVGSGSITQKMVIKSDGKVGIGTTAPGMPLHVYSAENALLHLESTDQDASFKMEDSGTGHFVIQGAADNWSLGTEGRAEMMRFSGSTAVVFNEDGADQDFRVETDTNNSMFCIDGGTNRVGVGTASPNYVCQVYGAVDGWLMQIENVTGSTPYGFKYSSSNAAPDNTTYKAIEFTDSSADRFQVYSDGDVKNHDGSYGSISDERIKTEITDANSQWDDIKAIRVVNFKRKDDVKQYGAEKAWKQLGVVAQELEAVCPRIVRNSPPNDFEIQECGFGEQDSNGEWVRKKDSDGNELEVKGVPYSILQMKAFKALQEAMTKIETLETKVKTLEDA